MLGIALIILLGYLVYHYRPKKLVMETKFKNALSWSEWGKCFPVGQSIVILGMMSIPSLTNTIWFFQAFLNPKAYIYIEDFLLNLLEPIYSMLAFGIDLFIIIPFVCFISVPLFFSWLIHRKLVKPLSEERIPSKKTFHFLFGMGLFYVILVGTFIVGTGYMSEALLNALIIGFPFLLIFFIAGVLAIGIAGHELRASLITNPTL